MSVGTPTINIPTVGKNNKSKISIGYKKAYNYVVDVTSPYGNVLSATEDNGEAQRYTYGLDVISVNAVKNSISGKKNEKDYYLQDELGSPLKLLDEKGSTLSGYSYSTFGTPSVITYLEGFCDDQNIFGYTGYQYDQASGLMYAQARYYLPETGRFTSKDSYKGNIENPETLNAYLYANSNPINYIDPSGHSSLYESFCNDLKYGNVQYGTLEYYNMLFERSNCGSQFYYSKNNRKPGKTPPGSWPKLPNNLAGKRPRWNSEGYWEGRNGGRYTWDSKSHGAGVNRGDGEQDGHWDDESHNNRWGKDGKPLPGLITPQLEGILESSPTPAKTPGDNGRNNIDWNNVGKTAVVVTAGVAIIGIALIPFTGGGSAILVFA